MAVLVSCEEINCFSFITYQTPFPKSPSTLSFPRTLYADSTGAICSLTPTRGLSLDTSWEDQDDEDQIVFLPYDAVRHHGQVENLEPSASLWTGDSNTVSLTSTGTSTNVSRPESPIPTKYAEDDTAIRTQPSKHVDYLSHNWKEEDIWSSWKHIVSKRRAYSNSARLENASWRTWVKSKNKLKTVSPESLGWLKDCDVTWLYGPLQTGSDKSLKIRSCSPASSTRISKSNPFLNKKPILKKRSTSEIMLQRSLFGSSQVKQAVAAVQVQGFREAGRRRDQPDIRQATSDCVIFPFSLRRMSRENPSLLPSVFSSGLASPGSGEAKHIHFNEQVEQYISLEMKGGEEEEPDSYAIHDYDGSDSDDGAIMIKRTNSKWGLPLISRKQGAPWASFSADSKTIAVLPHTTLKCGEKALPLLETAVMHNNGQPLSVVASSKEIIAVTRDRLQNLHIPGSSSSLNSCLSGMPTKNTKTSWPRKADLGEWFRRYT